jgi:hypothetical protein
MPSALSMMLVTMLEGIPSVEISTKLNSTNFTARKKVFAFIKGDGVVLKLPPETVKRLVSTKVATLLVMGKRRMKEWVVIRYKSPGDCRKHLALFEEAIGYVTASRK